MEEFVVEENQSRIAIWDITSRCNLRCSHCYNQERYWEKADEYKDLSDLEIKIIIDKLCDLNFTRVHLLGGEPLMAKHLEHIITYAKKKKLEVTMVTNGTLLDRNRYIKLVDLGVSIINVSIDGTNSLDNDSIRGEGSFESVYQNLVQIADYRRKNPKYKSTILQLSFTLTKTNLLNSNNIISFANSLDMDGVTISYLSNEGKARDNYDTFSVDQEEKFSFLDNVVEDYKKVSKIKLYIDARGWLSEYIYKKHSIKIKADEVGCKGGDGQFYILADGTMLPCSPAGTSMGKCLDDVLPANSNYPNLIEDSLIEIENSNRLICFYNYSRDKKTYSNIYPCNQCKYECFACPLLYHDNKIVEECVLAKKKIAEIDSAFSKQKFIKKDHIRVKTNEEKIELLDFISHNRYVVEGVGILVWNNINGSNTLEDISKQICRVCNEDIDYSVVLEDVLQFVYDLRALGFVKCN